MTFLIYLGIGACAFAIYVLYELKIKPTSSRGPTKEATNRFKKVLIDVPTGRMGQIKGWEKQGDDKRIYDIQTPDNTLEKIACLKSKIREDPSNIDSNSEILRYYHDPSDEKMTGEGKKYKELFKKIQDENRRLRTINSRYEEDFHGLVEWVFGLVTEARTSLRAEGGIKDVTKKAS